MTRAECSFVRCFQRLSDYRYLSCYLALFQYARANAKPLFLLAIVHFLEPSIYRFVPATMWKYT